MKIQAIESIGVVGVEVKLTWQDCIVLKGLLEDIKLPTDRFVRLSDADIKNITNLLTVVRKICGETVSLKESADELFDLNQEVAVSPCYAEACP